jgi:hypothetical protein
MIESITFLRPERIDGELMSMPYTPIGAFTTQVSGKYSPENLGLFDYTKLVPVPCTFPKGREILLYTHEFAVTTPEEAERPFDKTQIDFLRSVRDNPIHFVYDINGLDEGYMGESTSIETAYAMALEKPILIARGKNIHFGERVPQGIQEIITKNIPKLSIGDLDDWVKCPYIYEPEEDIAKTVSLHANKAFGPPEYDITSEDRQVIMHNVLGLTRKYRKAWKEFQEERSTTRSSARTERIEP